MLNSTNKNLSNRVNYSAMRFNGNLWRSLSFKMQISKREVKALFFKDTEAFYVELLLGEGDCPEKKEFPEVQMCS